MNQEQVEESKSVVVENTVKIMRQVHEDTMRILENLGAGCIFPRESEENKKGDILNQERVEKSKSVLGEDTVKMLLQVHEDAIWILENLGVGCHHPEILKTFQALEEDNLAIVYENRIYIMPDLAERCLKTVPGIADFFVPRNSFFIGGTAPHVYDDAAEKGGLSPSLGHVLRIAKTAEKSKVIAGMGKGVKLKNEILQMNIMAEYCSKPLYFNVNSEAAIENAKAVYAKRKNIMMMFNLTRSPLEVNENVSEYFVKTVKAGLPVLISAMPLAGVSAPYCYNGVLAMTHAEVLFGICAAQLLQPGITCIHAGCPTIADPRLDYNPNFGLISHNVVNILMTHLNLMLDIPTCQSAGTTHEAKLTERAIADTRMGQALCLKYGFHIMRHSFGFLRYLTDFSFAKLDAAIQIAETVTPADAPDVEMPVYDERGMGSIKQTGLNMYKEDSLTTVNLGKIFVN